MAAANPSMSSVQTRSTRARRRCAASSSAGETLASAPDSNASFELVFLPCAEESRAAPRVRVFSIARTVEERRVARQLEA